MHQGRFELINDVFNEALDIDADERSAFLNAACANDPQLRLAVERKLDAYEQGTRVPPSPVVTERNKREMVLDRGTLLEGRFDISRVIGTGGMGIVYEAKDKKDGLGDRRVAIKQAWPEFRELFQREARRLSLLHHPGIPQVYDLVCVGEDRFLVMEYIGGQTLSDLLTERATPFELNEVLDWARILLRTLDYLHTSDSSDGPFHRRDVKPTIHRDIKPENLMLSPDGHLYLLDFGIAKDGEPADTGRALTARGLVTPAYGPPEQCTNQYGEVSVRSDLYALGATLFHVLTNEPPPPAAYRLDAQSDPLDQALRTHRKQIPERLAGWLCRSMALNPDERPASAVTMLQELEEAVTAVGQGKEKETSPPHDGGYTRRRMRTVLFLFLATVTITGVVLYSLYVPNGIRAPDTLPTHIETSSPSEADAAASAERRTDSGEKTPVADGGPTSANASAEPVLLVEEGHSQGQDQESREVKTNFVFASGATRGRIEVDGKRITVLSGHNLPAGSHQISARSGILELARASVSYRENGNEKTLHATARNGVVDLTVEPNWNQLRIVLHLR